MEFKKGDKVICVYAENRKLIENQVYTILKILMRADYKYVVLKETPNESYWPHRFKKLTTNSLPDELFEL